MGKSRDRKLKVFFDVQKIEIKLFDVRKFVERKFADRTPASWAGHGQGSRPEIKSFFFAIPNIKIKIFDGRTVFGTDF